MFQTFGIFIRSIKNNEKSLNNASSFELLHRSWWRWTRTSFTLQYARKIESDADCTARLSRRRQKRHLVFWVIAANANANADVVDSTEPSRNWNHHKETFINISVPPQVHRTGYPNIKKKILKSNFQPSWPLTTATSSIGAKDRAIMVIRKLKIIYIAINAILNGCKSRSMSQRGIKKKPHPIESCARSRI